MMWLKHQSAPSVSTETVPSAPPILALSVVVRTVGSAALLPLPTSLVRGTARVAVKPRATERVDATADATSVALLRGPGSN